MLLTYAAILIGVIALLLAWRANKKSADLQERLAQANSRVYQLRRDIEDKAEQAEKERMFLKFEILKLKGDLKITPDMRVGEIVAAHPQAQAVLTALHLGGCSSCSVDDRETLGEAVAVNGRDLEPVLVALNTLFAESSNGHVSPDRLKLPNIQLHL